MTSNHDKPPAAEMFKGQTVGFIGSGVMGEAMIGALVNQHVVEPNQILASDVLEARGRELEARFGVRWTTDNVQVARESDVLVLSIKPQVLDKVLRELHLAGREPKVVLSIIAGVHIQQLSEGLYNPNVIRAMPNTPARIGQGITVWTATNEVPAAQREQARAILCSFGQEVFVDNEDYLDMATALSGTGPAYVFLFMEAMIDAGVHMGFSRRVAEQLVIQTMRGSVEYAAASGGAAQPGDQPGRHVGGSDLSPGKRRPAHRHRPRGMGGLPAQRGARRGQEGQPARTRPQPGRSGRGEVNRSDLFARYDNARMFP
jgi:pyrroline-5-carboxylate reductase